MVYTITLNPALDYVLKVDNLSFDDINRSSSETIFYGGKGINVSVILSHLGINNKALGFVAGFTGNELENMLLSDNINCDFIHTKTGNTRINVKIRAEKELDINANGPEVTNDEIKMLLSKLDCVSSDDFVVIAGSIPSNMPSDIYDKICKKASENGAKLVVDTSGKLLTGTLKYKPFLIKPNHLELGEIFGTKITNESDIIKYSKSLQEHGARNVLVSCAENGAILVDENGKIYKIKNAVGELINSVGCGDSMVAGFIAGYIQYNDYINALKLGTACGNATAFSIELATKLEIEHLLNTHDYEIS